MDARKLSVWVTLGWFVYAVFLNPIWADYRIPMGELVREHCLPHLAVGLLLLAGTLYYSRQFGKEQTDA